MNKKKILILGNNDSGLYDFRKEVLQAMLAGGYEVHVSVPDNGFLYKIKDLGCICHETVMDRRGMNPVKDLKLLLFYLRLLKQINPAVVLAYTIKPNIYGGLACRFKKVPCIATITGLGTALEGGGLLKKMLVFLYRTALKKASCIFFQNRNNLEFMKNEGCIAPDAPTALVSGSGVNLEEHRFCAYPEDDGVIFVSAMRIMKAKGVEELLAAAETIHREYQNVKFWLLGDYEEETKELYSPQITRLQTEGILEYYGYRDDIALFFERCHAVIHPSYHEGMSNVLQEAAAAGRPCLASNVSGCREIIENGVSGLTFTAQNTAALTECIRSFLALNYTDRCRMGQNARKYVEENFDREKVVKAYLVRIADIIEQKG